MAGIYRRTGSLCKSKKPSFAVEKLPGPAIKPQFANSVKMAEP
jgi:hypothetical protein